MESMDKAMERAQKKPRYSAGYLAPMSGPFVRQPFRPRQVKVLEDEEWLLTTGNGGFAMGTTAGTATRQYHTLLNAASTPPVGRIATISNFHETILAPEEEVPLDRYGDTSPGYVQPRLSKFEKTSNSVSWTLDLVGFRLQKTLRLGFRRNVAAVTYTVHSFGDLMTLQLRPQVLLRDFHSRMEDLDEARFKTTSKGDRSFLVEAEGYGVSMTCDSGKYVSAPKTFPKVDYRLSREREETLTFGEPLWSPGYFEVPCDRGTTSFTIAWALSPEEPDLLLPSNTERQQHLQQTYQALRNHLKDDIAARLLRPLADAADDFIVTRRVGKVDLITVIAGYPWFADWGRDSMISLPGLLLSTGRLEEAKRCLAAFGHYVKDGLIPNCFHDDGTVQYNTVDASLWYVEAVRAYAEASGTVLKPDDVLVRACVEIINGYRRGTKFGIKMDEIDGLVMAGDPSTQLTWMDALRNGIAFTPRYGKCVEINALWVNALYSVSMMLSRGDGERSSELLALAEKATENFNQLFIRPDGLGLYDRLEPHSATDETNTWVPVSEIRPNQLFAVSLKYGPLQSEARMGVVKVCRDQLLTPVGIRTLAPSDPGYRGRFKGDMMERDASYHNGTVWPWLLGAYAEAVLKSSNYNQEAREEVEWVLERLLREFPAGGCLGQIAEVYDGDMPRRAEGCPAQAWSVAEAMRLAVLVGKEEHVRK
mmetsp:Transcript_87213/g.182520  ORF Transcript_87213/g.182520 Transcript_87213/m.182520 type:complete len:705 (-) Transcript_87213:184-2298(-)